jgi:NADPH:quinone reductase-like Zn-dependent oxidoreductase
VIPGSDGAGIVLATGSAVSKFAKGDRVITHLAPGLEESEWPTLDHLHSAGLGQKANGTLTETGVFHQTALVKMPPNLSFEQAATLTCSALTAWNALFGLRGREVKAGDCVLVQGTGGVSIAALQVCWLTAANIVCVMWTVN